MRSRSMVRGALRTRVRRRPSFDSISCIFARRSRGDSDVWPGTAAVRNRGEPGGASTGSVSRNVLTRTMCTIVRSSWIARRNVKARSPRFAPRAMATVLLIRDVDLVGELVDVVGLAREKLLQMLARRRDRVDDPLGELAVLEADGQLRGDLVPEAGRHLLADAAVAEDHEALLLGDDEEQHAVARRRLRHAEALERPLRDEAEVAAARLRLHVHADLARRRVLRGADRLDDALLVEPRQELLLLHYQLPPAPPPPNELPPPPHEPPVPHPPPPPPPKPPPNVVPPPPPQNSGKMQPLHPPQPPRRNSGRRTTTRRMTMAEPDGPGGERETGR